MRDAMNCSAGSFKDGSGAQLVACTTQESKMLRTTAKEGKWKLFPKAECRAATSSGVCRMFLRAAWGTQCMAAFSRTEGTLQESPFRKRASDLYARGENLRPSAKKRSCVSGSQECRRSHGCQKHREAGQRCLSSLLKACVKGNLFGAFLPLPLKRDTFWLAFEARLRELGGQGNGHRALGPVRHARSPWHKSRKGQWQKT